MISDLRAAQLCAALYANTTLEKTVEFFHVDPGDDDGICWAIAQETYGDVVVLRGSVTPEDWLDDIRALPYMSRRMGYVHRGFYLGLDNVWSDLKPLLRPEAPIVICGHSLGAARSSLLTGIMVNDGISPIARIAFGEPKPGFPELASVIAKVPQRSYRNGGGFNHDVVTDLPFTIPRLGLHYVHPVPLTVVNADPNPGDSGMFVYHHMDLYVKALEAQEKST